MPVYGDEPVKHIRIQMPSDNTAEIWGTAELDYLEETRILSRSQRTEITADDKQVTVVDNAIFEYELLHTWLTRGDTEWNLYDRTGKALERTSGQINKIFKGARGRTDRRHIVEKLAAEFFPDMVKLEAEKAKEDEDPNPGSPPEGAVQNFLDTAPSSINDANLPSPPTNATNSSMDSSLAAPSREPTLIATGSSSV